MPKLQRTSIKSLAAMAVVVAILVCSVAWYDQSKSSSDGQLRMLSGNKSSSETGNFAPEAGGTDTSSNRAAPIVPSSDSGIVDVSTCIRLTDVERKELTAVAADWYGQYGDAKAKRYWPYQAVDDEILEQMSDQGDTEAMFQLGMNMLWRATRTEGERWQPEGSHLYEATPLRSELDRQKFYRAVRFLLFSFEGGKVFALRELIRVQVQFSALDELIGPAQEAFTEQEWKEVSLASVEMMENYFFPQLPNERLSFELNDRQRAKAEEFAANFHQGLLRRHSSGKVPAPLLSPPPDAVQRLAEDETCLKELAPDSTLNR